MNPLAHHSGALQAAHAAQAAHAVALGRYAQVHAASAQPVNPYQAAVNPMTAGYAHLLHGQGTRKNATRESTQQLKLWLNEHQKNPYPTKAEKVMLALLSGNY